MCLEIHCLGQLGGGMLLRSCACQMSQCSAVQSVSERMAWGRGVGGVRSVVLRGL